MNDAIISVLIDYAIIGVAVTTMVLVAVLLCKLSKTHQTERGEK